LKQEGGGVEDAPLGGAAEVVGQDAVAAPGETMYVLLLLVCVSGGSLQRWRLPGAGADGLVGAGRRLVAAGGLLVRRLLVGRLAGAGWGGALHRAGLVGRLAGRSEERRVGKECRR
jgi:hypothetical protein